jgi:hypothetical protein
MRAFAHLYAAADGPLRHGDARRTRSIGPSTATPVVLDQQVMSSGMPSLKAVNTWVSISGPVWPLARMGPVRATVLSAHPSSSGSPSARRPSHLFFNCAQSLAKPFPVVITPVPAPEEEDDEGGGLQRRFGRMVRLEPIPHDVIFHQWERLNEFPPPLGFLRRHDCPLLKVCTALVPIPMHGRRRPLHRTDTQSGRGRQAYRRPRP